MRDCRRGDQCIERARGRLSPRFTQARSHSAECARGVAIECDGIEVGFGLLQMRLACGPLVIGLSHVRPDRQLRTSTVDSSSSTENRNYLLRAAVVDRL
jgi:hypothetical protein